MDSRFSELLPNVLFRPVERPGRPRKSVPSLLRGAGSSVDEQPEATLELLFEVLLIEEQGAGWAPCQPIPDGGAMR